MFGKHTGEDSTAEGSRPDADTSRVDPAGQVADKPDSPGDLTKQSWLYVARRTVREFSDDQCTDLAAALTYYSVLAMFPAAIAILSLVGLVGQGPSTVDTLLQILRDIGAASAADTLEPTLTQLSSTPNSGLALILGLAAALWSASGYVGAFGRGMNRIYEIDEGRPIWKLRPAMLLVTVITVVLTALVALSLVLTGPAAQAVGDAIGLGSTVVTIWNIAKWPVMLAVVVLIVALLYYATPNVRQPKFRWISIGAVVAILTWVIASAAFGFYVANLASYNKTYGSLAGVIVFLLWLWITNLALLFGAELDAELERGRALQAGMPAEEVIQLPARDTRKSDKADQKERADIDRARNLRLTRGETQDGHQEDQDKDPAADGDGDRSGDQVGTRRSTDVSNQGRMQ
jgi:membrane protein